MRALIIDNGSRLLTKLQQLIPGDKVVKGFGEIKISDTENFNLIVLSGGGSHNVIYEESKFLEEEKIIRSGKPIIGICFGCELIARSFGGELVELTARQRGIYEIKILDKELGRKNVKVYEGHKWAISRLPENFEVLAKSISGPEIIKHKTLPIYGFQFHPENLVEQTEGNKLFLNILSRF